MILRNNSMAAQRAFGSLWSSGMQAAQQVQSGQATLPTSSGGGSSNPFDPSSYVNQAKQRAQQAAQQAQQKAQSKITQAEDSIPGLPGGAPVHTDPNDGGSAGSSPGLGFNFKAVGLGVGALVVGYIALTRLRK